MPAKSVERLHEIVPLDFLREMRVAVSGWPVPDQDALRQAVMPFVRSPRCCTVKVVEVAW